jgi:hypothetical protein
MGWFNFGGLITENASGTGPDDSDPVPGMAEIGRIAGTCAVASS